MDLIYDRANGAPDIAHRHDYYTILLVQDAGGEHLIDYKRFKFNPSEVHFVSPGQVHQVSLSERPKGWVITFTKGFLAENNIPESFISNINLFESFGHSPPLSIDTKVLQRLNDITTEMHESFINQFNYRNRALGALLQLFLIYCNNSCTHNPIHTEQNASVCILRDFKLLIDQNFTQWHMVKNYAKHLHISQKHLSQTIKDITGKTAKEMIQDRLILESKRLLLFSDHNVKSLSYVIGFEEPLHFSSFFKNKVGLSPTKYREANRST